MMNKERFTRVVEEMKRQGLTQILIADDPADWSYREPNGALRCNLAEG